MHIQSSQTCFSKRQLELQEKLLLSLAKEDVRQFGVLESLWVHRYGMNTLPDFAENVNNQNHEINSPEIHQEVPNFSENEGLSIIEDDQMVSIDCLKDREFINEEEEKQYLVNLETVNEGGSNSNELSNIEQETKVKKLIEFQRSSPPPSPLLRRLRRWIPSYCEGDLPEAS